MAGGGATLVGGRGYINWRDGPHKASVEMLRPTMTSDRTRPIRSVPIVSDPEAAFLTLS